MCLLVLGINGGRILATPKGRLQALADRDADHADNIFGTAAAGQIIDRLGESLKNRAVGHGVGEPFGQFVADVAGLQIRENQHVGVAMDGATRVFAGRDVRHNGGVSLHFAVHHCIQTELGEACQREFRGPAYFVHELMFGAPLG